MNSICQTKSESKIYIYLLIIIISNQIPKQQNRTMINNFESDAHINLIQFFYGGLGIAPTQTSPTLLYDIGAVLIL